MVLMSRPYYWIALLNLFGRDDPCNLAINPDAGTWPDQIVAATPHMSSHVLMIRSMLISCFNSPAAGVPVVVPVSRQRR